ncbi:MAG: ABC transporter permease [Rhizobiaceae bacterium]|nr:ABC transporter permease [Rhizobiaceae bacterium]
MVTGPRGAEAERPSAAWRSTFEWVHPALWIVGSLLAWELGCRLGNVPAFILPTPSQVLLRIAIDWRILIAQAWNSAIYILLGFLLGALPAVVLGLAMANLRWLEKALYPLVVFIQTTPQISIAPLLIVWFGYGPTPKVLLAGMIAFFPVLIDSTTGFKSLDPRLLYVTRSMGASAWQTLLRVRLPAALPLIVSGCRIALLMAVTVVIVVEFLSSNTGLGFVATRALANQDLPLMFAAIFVAVAIGLLFNALVDLFARLAMPARR